MSATLAPLTRRQAVDGNGKPIPSARLFYYDAGTSTKKDTFTTNALAVANANIVLSGFIERESGASNPPQNERPVQDVLPAR